MGLPMSIFIIYLFIFFFLPNIFKNSELQFWRGKEVKGTWFWLVLVFAKMRYLLRHHESQETQSVSKVVVDSAVAVQYVNYCRV